jgi:hypothetical protein
MTLKIQLPYIIIFVNLGQFDCDESYLKGQVVSLVLITLNTLDRHFHRCRVEPTTAVTSSSIHYPRGEALSSGCNSGCKWIIFPPRYITLEVMYH